MVRRLSPISCQLTRLATCARNDGRHRRVASTRDDANGVNGQLNFIFVSCHAIIHSFFLCYEICYLTMTAIGRNRGI
jgi:hypothetical protein